ncbi:MAG TPA: transglutaminase domain-containing protein [Thermoanaerobaculia bacterium]|jgi:hypothetical protein|nr:transglutaminase domain-containing protein [Thermoanaerobaculia bacterium]
MPRSPRFLVALACAVAISSARPAVAYRWKDPSPAERAIAEDPARGVAGAVYLEISEESIDDVFHVYVRAKVLSRTGFEIGTVDDLDEEAFEIEGRTVSATGVVTPLAPRDIRTITTLKAAGVRLRRKGFTMPALEPGSFVEYTYREYGTFGNRGPYHVEIPFQRKFDVLRESVSTPRAGFRYSSAIRFENGVTIRARNEPGRIYYEAENVPALHTEPHGLPEQERSAGLIFSYFFADLRATSADQYWKGAVHVGLVPWVKERLLKPSKVADRLKAIPGSHAADPAARLRALYAYVQSTLENRDALPAGKTPPKGGWKKNDDAADAFDHGSGDANDLVAAFVSLLRADGWTCRIVWCPDLQERVFHPQIPSIFQFDTEVVEVRDPGLPRPVYLSFEHPELPFGVVPWNHLDTDCYAVDLDTEKAEIVRIPAGIPAQNAVRRVWTMDISADGDAKIVRESHWTGEQGFEARSTFFGQGRAQYEKEIRDRYQKMDPPADVASVEVRHENEPDAEFVSTITFTRPALVDVGSRFIVAPLAMMRQDNPFTQTTRTEPIRFPYPTVEADAVTVRVPAGYVMDGAPRGYDAASEAGHYLVTARAEGDSVVVERLFELRRSSASAEAYPLYRSLFETAARGDAEFALVFRKGSAAPSR